MNAFALDGGFDPTFGDAPSTPLEREPRPAIPAGRVKFVHMRYSLLVSARLRLFVLIGAFALIAAIALPAIGGASLSPTLTTRTSRPRSTPRPPATSAGI